MNDNWEVKKLGETTALSSGNSAPQNKELFEDGKYPFFRTSDIGQIHIGEIANSRDYLNEKGIKGMRLFPKGTILVPKSGASTFLNHRVILGVDGFVSSHLATVNPNLKILDGKFLFYFLTTVDSKTLIQDIAYPSLKISDIGKIDVAFPLLPEQQRIVAILDEAFAVIAQAKENAEKNLQNARELFDSYLQSVFANPGDGWEFMPVGKVAKHSLGKMLDKSKNRGEFREYLRNFNVRWFEFDLSDLLEMRFREEETEQYTAIKGDVLVCEGGYPGRAAIWQEDYPIHFQKAIHRVRFNIPEYNKWFLYFLYLCDKNGDLKKYFTGSGIQHFTGKALSSFILPIAPLEKIKSTVLKLEALSVETKKLENIYRQKINDLDELKKSILQKTFNGEL
jgi:type I restriction enzyme S subunit